MREDLENLNFNELTELERQEYVAVLTYNLRRLCLQLINCGDEQLAGLFTVAVNLARMYPSKFMALIQYAFKLHDTLVIEQDMQRRVDAKAKTPEQTETKEEFPPLDSDREQ